MGPSFDLVSLRFVAVVDVARVPLHLAIGSPLDVYSQSEATQDWFSALLLGGHETAKNVEPWWQAATAQSPVGILTEARRENGDSPSPNLTEILFYAAGSGPGSTDTLSPEELNLRINALPLSSDLLHKLPAVATPPLSPQLPAFKSELDDVCAEFLPPLFDPPEVQEANTRKRQSVSSIFDEATERRKRARRHGGESISAAASKVNGPVLPLQHKRSTSSMGLQELFDPQNHVRDAPSRPTSSEGIKPGRKISRSPSLSIDPQALTRKGLLDGQQGKRSSLSRVTSVADPTEEPTTESRNKDIISRLVMAGMRMYGLQQRKKPSRPRKGSMASDVATSSYPSAAEDATISPEDAAKDEEYKLVYHQAYRGTVFAMVSFPPPFPPKPHKLLSPLLSLKTKSATISPPHPSTSTSTTSVKPSTSSSPSSAPTRSRRARRSRIRRRWRRGRA